MCGTLEQEVIEKRKLPHLITQRVAKTSTNVTDADF